MAAAKPHNFVLPARFPMLKKADSQQPEALHPRAGHDLEVAERTQAHVTTDTQITGQVFDCADQEEPQDNLWR